MAYQLFLKALLFENTKAPKHLINRLQPDPLKSNNLSRTLLHKNKPLHSGVYQQSKPHQSSPTYKKAFEFLANGLLFQNLPPCYWFLPLNQHIFQQQTFSHLLKN